MAFTLFVVGTPIGNLGDISPRALEVLGRVALIACEDPPHTQRLLARYEIQTPTVRFTDAYDRKKRERLQRVLAALGRGDVAYVSSAGMPLVSDPGYELIRAALDVGAGVAVVPGPTAVQAALLVSGLPTSSYTFKGYPPRKPGPLRRFFEAERDLPHTLVVFESPLRAAATLRAALDALGDRCAAVCIELTKKFERTHRGYLADLAAALENEPLKGEVVIVIAGNNRKFRRLEDDGPACYDPACRCKR